MLLKFDIALKFKNCIHVLNINNFSSLYLFMTDEVLSEKCKVNQQPTEIIKTDVMIPGNTT